MVFFGCLLFVALARTLVSFLLYFLGADLIQGEDIEVRKDEHGLDEMALDYVLGFNLEDNALKQSDFLGKPTPLTVSLLLNGNQMSNEFFFRDLKFLVLVIERKRATILKPLTEMPTLKIRRT